MKTENFSDSHMFLVSIKINVLHVAQGTRFCYEIIMHATFMHWMQHLKHFHLLMYFHMYMPYIGLAIMLTLYKSYSLVTGTWDCWIKFQWNEKIHFFLKKESCSGLSEDSGEIIPFKKNLLWTSGHFSLIGNLTENCHFISLSSSAVKNYNELALDSVHWG